MVYAALHVLLIVLLLEIYSRYVRYVPNYLIIIAGISCLFPDIDIIINQWFGVNNVWFLHGHVMHSIWFPIVFFLITFLLYLFKKRRLAIIALVFSIGAFTHLLLDCFGGGPRFLYPFSMVKLCPTIIPWTRFQELDAIWICVWLIISYILIYRNRRMPPSKKQEKSCLKSLK